jgi:hypothetical protein
MKRNMDTVRELLMFMEEHDAGLFIYQMLPPLPDAETTMEHVQMLISGGLIDQTHQKSLRISWQGHEFLDKVRDPEIWTKTKDKASKLGSWSVKLLGEIASGFIRAKAVELGLPLG